MKLNTFESLKKSSNITNLLNKGDKLHNKDFCLIYKISEKLEISNIVIIISKKNFKLAVARNKIRRQIRAMIIESKVLENRKVSMAIVVKQSYNIDSFENNKKQLIKLINKLGG